MEDIMLDDTKELLALANKNKIQAETEQVIEKEASVDPAVEEAATQMADKILSVTSEEPDKEREFTESVEKLGSIEQKLAASSEMLSRPIGDLMKEKEYGEAIGEGLLDLRNHIEDIDPGDMEFSTSTFARILGKIPFIGDSLEKYIERFSKTETIINEIIKSLENGQQKLRRNNDILLEDQATMRKVSLALKKKIKLAQILYSKLEAEFKKLSPEKDEMRYKFLGEKILFPLNQRIMDMQEMMLISLQAVMTYDVIIQNNKELIRGIERAKTNSIAALRVAVTAAIALADQDKQQRKIKALNQTTSNMILGVAERLKQQGVQIQKDASGPNLDKEKIKRAIEITITAIDDVTNFRINALEQQKEVINEYNIKASESEKIVKRIEKGKAANDNLFKNN